MEKRRSAFISAALIGLFLLLGCAVYAAGSVITAGQGVGSVSLGQKKAQVTALLGNPDQVKSSPNDPNAQLLFYKAKGLAVFVGSNGAVIGITVQGGPWKTPEGIGVGSAGAAVTKTYGQGLQRGQGNITYASKGIGFSIRNGVVSQIYIMKREDDRPLLGDRLIIPGARVGGIKIGMAYNQVAQAWGQADSVTSMGASKCTLCRYREEAIGLIVSASGQIEGMVMETGDFITKEGVKVGSSRDEVVRVFGKGSGGQNDLIYEAKGIGFRFTQNRVSQITVLKPGK